TRSSVAATCIQSCPLRASASSAPTTTHGAGRNSGLNGRVASTSPPATLHSTTKASSEVARQLSAVRRVDGAPRTPHSIIADTLLSNTAAHPLLAARRCQRARGVGIGFARVRYHPGRGGHTWRLP